MFAVQGDFVVLGCQHHTNCGPHYVSFDGLFPEEKVVQSLQAQALVTQLATFRSRYVTAKAIMSMQPVEQAWEQLTPQSSEALHFEVVALSGHVSR